MIELYEMLYAIFLPLLISWLFKRGKFKRIFLTYVISAFVVVFIPLFSIVIQTLNVFLQSGAPDTAALAGNFAEISGGLAIHLFVTLFFQYIFNRTMGLRNI